MDQYNLYFKLQLPIPFYDICQIYQPTLGEILDKKIGMTRFENLLFPFCITPDAIQDLSDEEKEKIKSFDILLSNPELAASLCQSLEFFCRSEIRFVDGQIYFGDFKGGLNRDNFDEFADVILEMSGRKRPEIERPPDDPRRRDIWEKLREGRERKKKENEVKLEDIINICQYGGEYYISKDEILNFTLWELMNCYKNRLGISNYKDAFAVYIVAGDKKLVETHWSDIMKINYKSGYNEHNIVDDSFIQDIKNNSKKL